MSTLELYTKGARIWLPDPVHIWRPAEVLKDFKEKVLEVQFENGETQSIKVESVEKMPHLRNPEILIGENDLTSLSYLHEPAGIVLVAINPYEDLPIYDVGTVMAYRGQAMGDLDPHIFAVAEEAYTQMERENQNQSIIVSGESGAGKTMSAKHAMRYFATVGGSSTQTQVEKKVLASNPIMEAIGNAKTTRNDNSSRFGKYIEIDFNNKFNIMGAEMRTYLLEKSRVVFQAADERNYHIFYQLCASADLEEFQDFQLSGPDNFKYTNQGNAPVILGVNDSLLFQETRNAFSMLGFSQDQQMKIFRILASILHLGNVEIVSSSEDSESSQVKPGDLHLIVLGDLLGVDAGMLGNWLCNRQLQSMRDIITKPLTADQAAFSKDALSKHIYAKLFDWIVTQINKSLCSDSKIYRFIGVLDIYGFETFEINSFEQFCINYANEKLQQQFNSHVFKLEQEEYLREQIEWKLIDFYDNQPCIDLIESKLGILDLLDEECRMPKGSDDTWCQKLYDKCKKWKHFEKPRLSNTAFMIHHFADEVKYETVGFLEKNRDTVMEEQIRILRGSSVDLVAELFEEEASRNKLKPVAKVQSAAPGQPSTKQHKKTVGSQFRESLALLMNTLNSTTPHYVRCIKPNDQKAPFTFDAKRAVQQLRACGVLETVRISAAGYPSRWTYQDFLTRYRVLNKGRSIKSDVKGSCKKILEVVIKDEDKFQFGKTKIFFRAGQVAYLEKLRADKLRACALIVQKQLRGWLQRKRFLQLRRGTLFFQRRARGCLARRHAHFLRCTKAATTIQKHVRGFVCQKKYQRLRCTALGLQSLARGMWARQRFLQLRKNAAAKEIQRHVRGWLARVAYKKNLNRVVIVQCCIRRFLARRQLKKLKVEARSVEHMKKLNIGLENKIISLQQKIQEMAKEHKTYKAMEIEFRQVSTQLESSRNLEASVKQSNNKIAELEREVSVLRNELDTEKTKTKDLVTEKELLKKEQDQAFQKMNMENLRLKEDLDRMNELIKANESDRDALIKKKLAAEKATLLNEFDAERAAYQKMVKEHARVEQRCENLQNELIRIQGGGGMAGHKRTPSDISLLSLKSDTTEIAHDDTSDVMDEDIGYESVRIKNSEHMKLEEISWEPPSKEVSPGEEKDIKPPVTFVLETEKEVPDVSVLMRLQQRLKEMESEKQRLERQVEHLLSRTGKLSPGQEEKHTRDSIRLHELEMENAKIKEDLKKLRNIPSDDSESMKKEIMSQRDALQDELERRREECIQLRTVLANQSIDMRSAVEISYANKGNLNEDGELLMAFESQKKLIRQLEAELENQKLIHEELRNELERLQDDNERQQKLISQNLKKTPQAQTEAILQHEINRLTGENMDLREKNDNLVEQSKKLKRQLKLYAKKLKDGNVGVPSKRASLLISPHGTETGPMVELKEHENMPIVKHKETEYMGMFEYKKEDELTIIKAIIYDLKPKIAIDFPLPGLPAYIIFMCIRHTDHINDDDKVRSLLNSTIFGIKRLIKKKHEDIEYTVMWLANTCRLLHNLKQYSGDVAFQSENTPKQNEQCLRNFDLAEYRQVLSDIAVWIYQAVIKIMEENVQPLIVPAVLEHEAIPGISGNKPIFMRGRSSSVAREIDSPIDPQKAVDALLKELSTFYRILNTHGVDPELISQVFKQLFYFICAGALNNLLLRKDMCHWSKGMQIRYNLSHLEQWCRDQKVNQLEVTSTLGPIVQASQLLQARKTDDDAQSICAMCEKLTTAQIIKILNLYTPADEYEERVPVSFIRKIQGYLSERDSSQPELMQLVQTTLLMDTKHAFPIRFPFNPSSVRLEDIKIPDTLALHSILRKV